MISGIALKALARSNVNGAEAGAGANLDVQGHRPTLYVHCQQDIVSDLSTRRDSAKLSHRTCFCVVERALLRLIPFSAAKRVESHDLLEMQPFLVTDSTLLTSGVLSL